MLQTMRLHALRMKMLCVGVNPAYSSMVALAKYSRQFGGFNRHQLAAFVVARRALGYGEAPALSCLPETKKERRMWNHCLRYYGYQPQIQTSTRHEPLEWKSAGDNNGGGMVTELLRARPTNTPEKGLGHNAHAVNHASAVHTRSESRSRWVGSVHPNRHTIGGDGATGYRVSPAPMRRLQSSINDVEDTVGSELSDYLID